MAARRPIEYYIERYGKADALIMQDGTLQVADLDMPNIRIIFHQINTFDKLLTVGSAVVEGRLNATPWHAGPVYGYSEEEIIILSRLHTEKRIMTLDGQGGLCVHYTDAVYQMESEEKPYLEIMIERENYNNLKNTLDTLHASGVPIFYRAKLEDRHLESGHSGHLRRVATGVSSIMARNTR